MKFYGYARCSTCRKALAWLGEHGLVADVVDITLTPPSRAELEQALSQIGRAALLNTSGQSYRAIGAAAVKSMDDATLLAQLDAWLGPRLEGQASLADLQRLDLAAALLDRLDWRQRSQLDQLAPVRWPLPGGRGGRIDYTGDEPVLSSRLQDFFGLTEGPRLADGRHALLLHLLSPAGRPAAVTRDLASFWRQGYPLVRKDLRGRYPKHRWPEDPLAS